MPKDNNQSPTTTPTTNNNDQSPIFVEETLPPMPQEQNKQDIKPVEIPTPTVDTGSASPQDEKIMPPIVTASKSKKKFTKGKIIATILGLFLLIGGAGAGVFLVKQNQNINEKAAGTCQYNNAICRDMCLETEKGNGANEPNCDGSCCIPVNPTSAPVAAGCSGNTCSVGDFFSATCYVTHFGCNKITTGFGCNDWEIASKVESATFNQTCGGEQIDVFCPGHTIPGNGYISTGHTNPCNGEPTDSPTNPPTSPPTAPPTTPPTAPPTAGPGTGSCSDIKAYSKMWVLLSPTELSSQKAGDTVIFCVAGSTSSGSFDKAKFTINGVAQSETTDTRPGSQDFCQVYSIPYGVTTFNIRAQIHFYCRGCAEEGWK